LVWGNSFGHDYIYSFYNYDTEIEMKNLLEIDSIILEYGLKIVLQNVYLKSETGKVTGLLGRNGTGKSSLMKIIFGEINPSGRSVRLNSKALLGINRDPNEIRYLPQHNFIPKSFRIERVFKDLELDFQGLVNEFPSFEKYQKTKLKQLSSGERRIVEIYSILVSKTKFCMLDEPFSQVMPIHIEKIKNIIVREKENKGIILTDHMYGHIVDICDDLYVISNGKTHLTENIQDLERLGYAKIN
jgi:ABC-type lipopolysaccharide export system ATPase subunit